MYFSFSALIALAVALLASADPVRHARSAGFTVRQSVAVRKPRGALALKNALVKYHATVPDHVQAAATNGNVSATAPGDEESQYLSPITIGNQTLNVVFDTGSADLWVFSNQTPPALRAGHKYYTPGPSATKLLGYTWRIKYEDDSFSSGDVYTDTLNVGGAVVTDQAIELAKNVSSTFAEDKQSSGILGLAFSSINLVSPKKQTTFFDTAIKEGVLSSSLFTANLKKGVPGSYDFGYIDSSQYTGPLHCVTITKANGLWQFNASGTAIGTQDFNPMSINVIADTGTSLLLMSNTIVKAYYNKVSGASYSKDAGGYIFPCSSTLPSFSVGIGSWMAVVPSTYMLYANAGSGQCFGGLQSKGTTVYSILGDIFLKAFFVVFDEGNSRVCFANKKLEA